jgi:hypothetical protein
MWLACVLCVSITAHAQTFKAGNFAKATATGDQVVPHNLGITPSALILWTVGKAAGVESGEYLLAFGITDGTTLLSVATVSQTGNTKSNNQRSMSNTFRMIQVGSVVLAEATLKSWDATNFTLTWTTADATAEDIHFIAIGGSGISAKVIDWTTTNFGVTGNESITTVGFQPNVLLNFGIHSSSSYPVISTDAAFMLGVADAGGHQWATTFRATYNVRPTVTARDQRTDSCILETSAAQVEQMRASCTSMDATGFTVNFSQNNDGANHIFSLALAGLNLQAGSFNKSTTAAPPSFTQSVGGVLFQPAFVLLSTFENATSSTPLAHGVFAFGATDGTHYGAISLYDTNARSGSQTEAADLSDHVYREEDVGNVGTGPEAVLNNNTFDANGFTLNFDINNSVNGAVEMLYLAFAPLSASAVRLESFTATRLADGRTRLEWRTGYEVDNLGFRVYREQKGQRVRITPSLVPGTALIRAGQRLSSTGQAYEWWDAPAPPLDAGPVQYWLEDLDLHGKRTWHGPIEPGQSPAAVIQPQR